MPNNCAEIEILGYLKKLAVGVQVSCTIFRLTDSAVQIQLLRSDTHVCVPGSSPILLVGQLPRHFANSIARITTFSTFYLIT